MKHGFEQNTRGQISGRFYRESNNGWSLQSRKNYIGQIKIIAKLNPNFRARNFIIENDETYIKLYFKKLYSIDSEKEEIYIINGYM